MPGEKLAELSCRSESSSGDFWTASAISPRVAHVLLGQDTSDWEKDNFVAWLKLACGLDELHALRSPRLGSPWIVGFPPSRPRPKWWHWKSKPPVTGAASDLTAHV